MGNPASLGHPPDPLAHLLPVSPPGSGEMHQAVIRSHPDDLGLHRARSDGQDGGVVLGARCRPGSARRSRSCLCFSGSFVVRSPLMICQLSPRFVVLWTNWLP